MEICELISINVIIRQRGSVENFVSLSLYDMYIILAFVRYTLARTYGVLSFWVVRDMLFIHPCAYMYFYYVCKSIY